MSLGTWTRDQLETLKREVAAGRPISEVAPLVSHSVSDATQILIDHAAQEVRAGETIGSVCQKYHLSEEEVKKRCLYQERLVSIKQVAALTKEVAGLKERLEGLEEKVARPKPRTKQSEASRLIVEKILNYIRDLEKKGSYRIYFTGEADCDIEGRFQDLADRRKIGVIARSKTAGLSLLHLVRVIFDNDLELLNDEIFEASREKESVTVKSLIASFVETEGDQFEEFEMDDPIELTIVNDELEEETITMSLSDIDLWTFERVKNELTKLL